MSGGNDYEISDDWADQLVEIRSNAQSNPMSAYINETIRQYPAATPEFISATSMAGLSAQNPELAAAVRADYQQRSLLARAADNTIGRITRPVTGMFQDVWDIAAPTTERFVVDMVQQYDRYGTIDPLESFRAAGLPIIASGAKAVVQGESTLAQAFTTGLGTGMIAGNSQNIMAYPGAGKHLQNLMLQGATVEEALEETTEWVADKYGAPIVNNSFEAAELTQLHVTFNGVDYGYGVSAGRLVTTPLAQLNLIQPKSVPANLISLMIDGASQLFLDPMDPSFYAMTHLWRMHKGLAPRSIQTVNDVNQLHGGLRFGTRPAVPGDAVPSGNAVDGWVFSGTGVMDDTATEVVNGSVTNDLERAVNDAKAREAEVPGTGRIHVFDEETLPLPVRESLQDFGEVENFVGDKWIYPEEMLDGLPERLATARTRLEETAQLLDEANAAVGEPSPEYQAALDEWQEYLDKPEGWKSIAYDEAEVGEEVATKVSNLEDEYQQLNKLLYERDRLVKEQVGISEVNPRFGEIEKEMEEILGRIFDPATRGIDAPPMESLHEGKTFNQINEEAAEMQRLIDDTGDPTGEYQVNLDSLMDYKSKRSWQGPAATPGGQADEILTRLVDEGLTLTDDEFREAEDIMEFLWESQYRKIGDPTEIDVAASRLEDLIGEFATKQVMSEDDLARQLPPPPDATDADVIPIRVEDKPKKFAGAKEAQARADKFAAKAEKLRDEKEALSAEFRRIRDEGGDTTDISHQVNAKHKEIVYAQDQKNAAIRDISEIMSGRGVEQTPTEKQIRRDKISDLTELQTRLEFLDREIKDMEYHGVDNGAIYNEAIERQRQWEQLTGNKWKDSAVDYDPAYEKFVEQQGDELGETIDEPEVAGTKFSDLEDRLFNEIWMELEDTKTTFQQLGFEFNTLDEMKNLRGYLAGSGTTDVNRIIRKNGLNRRDLLKKLNEFLFKYEDALAERTARGNPSLMRPGPEGTATPSPPTPEARPLPYLPKGDARPPGVKVIEVTTTGDEFGQQFSAFNAQLKSMNGKTIEYIYQVDFKGYDSIKAGKRQPPKPGTLNANVSAQRSAEVYAELWDAWARENPELIKQLDEALGPNGVLHDKYETQGGVVRGQAYELARIIQERRALASGTTVPAPSPKPTFRDNPKFQKPDRYLPTDEWGRVSDEEFVTAQELAEEFKDSNGLNGFTDDRHMRNTVAKNNRELEELQRYEALSEKNLQRDIKEHDYSEKQIKNRRESAPRKSITQRIAELKERNRPIVEYLDKYANLETEATYREMKRLGRVQVEGQTVFGESGYEQSAEQAIESPVDIPQRTKRTPYELLTEKKRRLTEELRDHQDDLSDPDGQIADDAANAIAAIQEDLFDVNQQLQSTPMTTSQGDRGMQVRSTPQVTTESAKPSLPSEVEHVAVPIADELPPVKGTEEEWRELTDRRASLQETRNDASDTLRDLEKQLDQYNEKHAALEPALREEQMDALRDDIKNQRSTIDWAKEEIEKISRSMDANRQMKRELQRRGGQEAAQASPEAPVGEVPTEVVSTPETPIVDESVIESSSPAPPSIDVNSDVIDAARQRKNEIRQEVYQTHNPREGPEPKTRPMTPEEAKEAWLDVDAINTLDEAEAAHAQAGEDLKAARGEMHGFDDRKRLSVEVHAYDGETSYVRSRENMTVHRSLSIEEAEAMLDEGYFFPEGPDQLAEARRYVDEDLGLQRTHGEWKPRDVQTWLSSGKGAELVGWLNDPMVPEYLKIKKLRANGVPIDDIQKMLFDLRKEEPISAYEHVVAWVNDQRVTETFNKPGIGEPRAAATQMASNSRLTGATKMPKAKRIIGDWGRRWMSTSTPSRFDPWDFDATFETIVNQLETIGASPDNIDGVVRAAYNAQTFEAMHQKVLLLFNAEIRKAMIRRGYDADTVMHAMETYQGLQKGIAMYNVDAVGNPMATTGSTFEMRRTAGGQPYVVSLDHAISDSEISLSFIHVPSVRELRRATSGGRRLLNKIRVHPLGKSEVLFTASMMQRIADDAFATWRNVQLARIGWMTSVLPDEIARALFDGHGEAFRNPIFIWAIVMMNNGNVLPDGRMLNEAAKAAGGLGVGMAGAGAGDEVLKIALGPESMTWTSIDPRNAAGQVTLDGARQIARQYISNYNSALSNALYRNEWDIDRTVEYLLGDPDSPLEDILSGKLGGGVPGEDHPFTLIKKEKNINERRVMLSNALQDLYGRQVLLSGGDYVRRNPLYGKQPGEPQWINSGGAAVETYDGYSPKMGADGKPLLWTKKLLVEEIIARDPKATNLYSKNGAGVTKRDLQLRLLEMDGIPDLSNVMAGEHYVVIVQPDRSLMNLTGSGTLTGYDDPYYIRRDAQRRVLTDEARKANIADGNRVYVTLSRNYDENTRTITMRSSPNAVRYETARAGGYDSIIIIDTSKLDKELFWLLQEEYIDKGVMPSNPRIEQIWDPRETSDEMQTLFDTFGMDSIDDYDLASPRAQRMIDELVKLERTSSNQLDASDLSGMIEERIGYAERQLIFDEMTPEDVDDFVEYIRNVAFAGDVRPPARIKAPAGPRQRSTLTAGNEFFSSILMMLGQKPSEFLVRNPFTKIRAWETAAEFYIYASPSIQKELKAAALAADITEAQFNRFIQRGMSRHGLSQRPLPAAVQLSIEEITDVMVARAIEDTRDLFFDLSKRGNWADAMKLIFPFGDAWWEIVTRWGKINNPVKARNFGQPFKNLRRIQQGTMAGQRSGWFEENERGERVFSWFPGPAMITALTTDVAEGVVPLDEVAVSSLGFVDFMETRDMGAPGTSPLVQVGGSILRPFVEDHPAMAKFIDTAIYGGFSPASLSEGLDQYIFPTWTKNFIKLLNSGEHDVLYASMQLDYMNAAIASDPKWANISTDRRLQQALLEEARVFAANYATAEVMTSFMWPTQAQLDVEAIRMGQDEIINPTAVANDYAWLIQHMGPEEALITIQSWYGVDPSTSMAKTYSVTSIPLTQQSYVFMQQFPDARNVMPYTVAAFMPPEEGGAFYQPEFNRQLTEEERIRLTAPKALEINSYKQGLARLHKVKEERDILIRDAELRFGRDSSIFKEILFKEQLHYNNAKRGIEAMYFGYAGAGGPAGVTKRPKYEQLRDEMLRIGTRGTVENEMGRTVNLELTKGLEQIASWWEENNSLAMNLGHEAQWWYAGSAQTDTGSAAIRSEFNTRLARLVERTEDVDTQQQLKWYVDYIVTPLMTGFSLDDPFIVTIDPFLIEEG